MKIPYNSLLIMSNVKAETLNDIYIPLVIVSQLHIELILMTREGEIFM